MISFSVFKHYSKQGKNTRRVYLLYDIEISNQFNVFNNT